MNTDPRKAAVIGCGFVGASIAFRFLQQGLFSKMVLLDMNREKAEGEAAANESINSGPFERSLIARIKNYRENFFA